VREPSGLVTLLFMDIEGSTRAWESHPAEMQIALERHDEILRQRIEAADGYVFKTVGDRFCAAFAEPAQAIHSAVAIQRALAIEQWPPQVPIRVRIGIHSGVCQERDGDYFGPTVNRTARLQATAHGGQLVVSGATAGLIRGLPGELSLRDLGQHRLKDLGEPERVYQVCDDSLPREFPPLLSLDSPDLIHNLPAQSSSFIGRGHELEDLRSLFEESRVVTLTGSGGVGKTRLALQLAADLLDGSGDGVWFVDLASLSDPGLVAAKAASAIGIQEEPGRSVRESLVVALRARRLLLVLDNCEHVIGEAATLVDELVKRCPQVAILATSREPLRVAGEHLYRVPSLSIPAGDGTVNAVLGSEAARLFLERAAEQQSEVALDAENAAVVGRLCRRLDGIPLAIELAAARMRSMSLSDLERRLDRRLRLLTGGSRTALPRQQTLEALIDWSYDLLNPVEQDLLDRLSVFAGSFDLDAAEAVVSSRTQSSFGVLDRLAALVDKSLVETDRTTALRYRLLESVSQYAAAKLVARGDDAVRAVREAHRDHYLALAETAAPHLIGHGQLEWLDRLGLEIDNLRSALAYCLDDPDPAPGLRLSGALCYFWNYREPAAEGAAALSAALDRADAGEQSLTRGRALVAAATLLPVVAGEYDAGLERAHEALAIADVRDEDHLRAQALVAMAYTEGERGNTDAYSTFASEALELARALAEPFLVADILMTWASWRQLTHADRVRAFEECLLLCRQIGNEVLYVRALCNLGYEEIMAGELAAARTHLIEGVRRAEEMGDTRALAFYACNLGFAAYLDGADAEAWSFFKQSLSAARRSGHVVISAYGHLGLALLAGRAGEPFAATQLHAVADAIHHELGTRVQGVESTLRDDDIARLRAGLGDAEFEVAYRAGRERWARDPSLPADIGSIYPQPSAVQAPLR
jgi:predicted ATPase/class 3 adenylate cyclase